MLAGLLAWNVWLTVRLFNYTTIGNDNRTVIQNTVNGYTTDITNVVSETRSSLVQIQQGGHTVNGVIFVSEKDTVYIMTSGSNLSPNAAASVRFDNGVSVDGTVAGTDTESGLAMVTVQPGFEVKTIKLGNSALINAGEQVVSLGARRRNESPMITTGAVSSVAQMPLSQDTSWIASVLEADLKVSEENVGGAMLNLSGELLGIIIPKPFGGQVDMGYAVSVNEVRTVYAQFRSASTVTRGCLGVIGRNVSEMTSYEKSALNITLDRTTGVSVSSTLAGSAADGLLEPGDLITAVDGKTLAGIEDLHSILYTHHAKDSVSFAVIRNGEEKQIVVTLQ